MAKTEKCRPQALIVSLLSNNEPARSQAVSRLLARFGTLTMLSQSLLFTDSKYYEAEMGPGLSRRLLLFQPLVDEQRLPIIKRVCISLEQELSCGGRRLVNRDPGLLSRENLVLATTKPNPHRLCLGHGIYGDLTLLFQHGGFVPLPWTYPDYASRFYRDLLSAWRRRYLWALEHIRCEITGYHLTA
jgi:hypothetical protein